MGSKYLNWQNLSDKKATTFKQLKEIVCQNRNHQPITRLNYGDSGLYDAARVMEKAIRQEKHIALYADYDVDGTMSCVSWIWFFNAISYKNYSYYIPDRFKEGYGLNLNAVQYLVEQRKAQTIITMDTGITANQEAQWCRSRGVDFVCTDHHKIQPDQLPDAVILNPKCHPDPQYQELCGCGITFVLLRKLASMFPVPESLWTDLLALTGMATICDLVPLNPVNHRLAQQGVQALVKSNRPILKKLLQRTINSNSAIDEQDIGFRLGPRINAVGRMAHGHKVIEAFIHNQIDPLLNFMETCNEDRKRIQQNIVEEACLKAEQYKDDPILFLGGKWHQGVVGIAASRLVEEYWKPVWLFEENRETNLCKGSARSIPEFDVTNAMMACQEGFKKFGGHQAAGGFSFSLEKKDWLHQNLMEYANQIKNQSPHLWKSSITYDCELCPSLLTLNLLSTLAPLRPFGFGFKEPVFSITAPIQKTQFYFDKITQKPKHTAVHIKTPGQRSLKIMFFHQAHKNLFQAPQAKFLITAQKNHWRGQTSLSLIGQDYTLETA